MDARAFIASVESGRQNEAETERKKVKVTIPRSDPLTSERKKVKVTIPRSDPLTWVVYPPPGTRILTAAPPRGTTSVTQVATTVRVVNDPKAIPVVLTRDPTKATGQFYHEGISE